MKNFLAFLFCTTLVGCSTPTPQKMYHPSASASQVERDNLECRMEAMKVEASTANVIIGAMNAREAMDLCLKIRGYK
jgi:hypothetical protein